MPESIPVIGARKHEATVHAVTMQAVITCDCDPSKPLVIGGFDRKLACPSCGTVYVIQRIDYAVDVSTGDATLHQAIARLDPAPTVQIPTRPLRRAWNNN